MKLGAFSCCPDFCKITPFFAPAIPFPPPIALHSVIARIRAGARRRGNPILPIAYTNSEYAIKDPRRLVAFARP
jgi:hypothetical protein